MNRLIPNRANTPEQKEEVLRRIAEFWHRHPELRLMQMLTCAMKVNDWYAFNVEDYDLLKYLEEAFPSTLNQGDGTKNIATDPGTL